MLARILHQAQGRPGSPRGTPSQVRLLEYLTKDIPPASLYAVGTELNPGRNTEQKPIRERPGTKQTTLIGFNVPSTDIRRSKDTQTREPNKLPESKKDRECNFRYYGDKMEPKEDNIIRIYSQNINGISVDTIQENLTKNLDVMLDRQVDIMGWAETNVEWNDYPAHLLSQRVFRKQYPGGKWLTTTSAIPSDTNLKPGGNALGLNHDTNSRTTATGKDPLGRWLWATMEGMTDSVTIIQLYVPGDPSAQGITMTYAQQYEQIQLKHKGQVPDVMGQYYRDLHQFIARTKTKIIVMGDFNEGHSEKNLLDL